MALRDLLDRLRPSGGSLKRAADAYVSALQGEPEDEDVRWLASLTLSKDLDHARWELRYARRALGLLAAERDALNDSTPSAVARALSDAFVADPNVAAEHVELAEAQFDQRLLEYRTAMGKRDGRELAPQRMARVLLTFAGAITSDVDGAIARGAGILSRDLALANEVLRRAFGTAELPEDVKPSDVVKGAGGQG